VKTVTYGRTEVVLPYLEDNLRTVENLSHEDSLTDYLYTGHNVRQVSLSGGRLSNGRIHEVEARKVTLEGVRIDSADIEKCVWNSLDMSGCNLSRVIFRGCKILGARFCESKWANVVFDGCRIEYSDIDAIRATGPIVFVNTTLKEVRISDCILTDSVIKNCQLRSVEFVRGEYGGLDLRGTDLSAVRGAANLDGVLINPTQRDELAEALVAELDLHYPQEKP
jgi:uncharacterized protein YjbI with pentapeptide repeats